MSKPDLVTIIREAAEKAPTFNLSSFIQEHMLGNFDLPLTLAPDVVFEELVQAYEGKGGPADQLGVVRMTVQGEERFLGIFLEYSSWDGFYDDVAWSSMCEVFPREVTQVKYLTSIELTLRNA